jgi:hypothetical protein
MSDIISNLVSHYKCNENAADTTVTDNIGGINGTAAQNTSAITTTNTVTNSSSTELRSSSSE